MKNEQCTPNFGRLVLFCIEADFCVQIRILQHFSRSTRFANLCTAPDSKFQSKIAKLFSKMNNELFIFLHFLIEFCRFEAKIRWIFLGISPNFLENLKICREFDEIPEKMQYFSGKLQKKIGKLWNSSIFGLNNSFASLVLAMTAIRKEHSRYSPSFQSDCKDELKTLCRNGNTPAEDRPFHDDRFFS